MIVGYHELNQVVAPTSVAELDIFIKQISTASGTLYVAIDLVNMFFQPLINKQDQKQVSFKWKGH